MRTSTDLEQIVLGAQRGEPDAFDRLVEEYGPRLFGFSFRLMGRKEDAEDIVQEVFMKVVRTITRYRHEDRFDAWLFRIAANTVRDRIRQSKRARALDSLERGSDLDAETDFVAGNSSRHEPPVDGDFAVADEVDRMQRNLERLPLAEREVIMLRHYSDMSFAEIAELMGTPLGTALARAHRGLGKLREWMESGT